MIYSSHCANKITRQFSLWFLYDVDYYYYSYITRSVETYISLPTQREEKRNRRREGENQIKREREEEGEEHELCDPLSIRSNLRKRKKGKGICVYNYDRLIFQIP